MTPDEYLELDGLDLADLVRRKEVKSVELVDLAFERIDALNPELNAVVERREAKARAEAENAPKGPFWGVPFLVKDMDGVLGGEPNTSSSKALVDWRPQQDSELFTRFKQAGAVIVGKTNAPEFGIKAITESALRGPCRNPWNLDHVPGGSSGGSAAAVAARIVPVAHAGDGGGSIRIPASSCGIFGLKPTRGRQPLGPYVGEGWSGLVQPGVVSISVRDSAAMLDATHGADLGAPYAEPPAPKSFLLSTLRKPKKLRIGYSVQAFLGEENHSDCVAAVEDASELLEELGHEVVEVDFALDRVALAQAYMVIVAAGVGAAVEATKAQTGRPVNASDYEPETWFLKQAGDAFSARDLYEARGLCDQLGRDLAQIYVDHDLDVHLSSTTAAPPVRIGELSMSPIESAALATLRRASSGFVIRKAIMGLAESNLAKTPNTQIYNMSGQPAMSVPLYWNDEGLPIGTQFAGRFGDERTLFQLAAQLEVARPWAHKIPRIARP